MIRFNSGSIETVAQVASRTSLTVEALGVFNGRTDLRELRDYTYITPVHSHKAGKGVLYFTPLGISRMLGELDVLEE